MSPRGRHEPGRHAAGKQQPADQDWARTSDRSTWRAYRRGLVLTVTRLTAGGWQAVVEGPGVTERGPAQRWADSRAGGAA
jgi:hypothetical protein